jgi:hypothetical protein
MDYLLKFVKSGKYRDKEIKLVAHKFSIFSMAHRENIIFSDK